jgi:hypothetical protein
MVSPCVFEIDIDLLLSRDWDFSVDLGYFVINIKIIEIGKEIDRHPSHRRHTDDVDEQAHHQNEEWILNREG